MTTSTFWCFCLDSRKTGRTIHAALPCAASMLMSTEWAQVNSVLVLWKWLWHWARWMNTGTEGGHRPAWVPVTMLPGALAHPTLHPPWAPSARLTPLLLILGLPSCFLPPNTWFGAQPLGVDTWTLKIQEGCKQRPEVWSLGHFGRRLMLALAVRVAGVGKQCGMRWWMLKGMMRLRSREKQAEEGPWFVAFADLKLSGRHHNDRWEKMGTSHLQHPTVPSEPPNPINLDPDNVTESNLPKPTKSTLSWWKQHVNTIWLKRNTV